MIQAAFRVSRPTRLSDWFTVSFDDVSVHVRAEPPGQPGWSQSFR